MEITIREARVDDGKAVSEIYAPYVTGTPISFEEEVPDASAMSQRIRDTLAQCPYLVAEIGDHLCGYAYAGPHRLRASYRWSVDVSVYLDRKYHRLGVGRALYQGLFALLVRQGFVMAYAGITLPNRASVGLHEAVGFTPVGVYRGVGFKLGVWHDVGWWQRQLIAPSPRPIEPTPWPAMPRLEPRTLSVGR